MEVYAELRECKLYSSAVCSTNTRVVRLPIVVIPPLTVAKRKCECFRGRKKKLLKAAPFETQRDSNVHCHCQL